MTTCRRTRPATAATRRWTTAPPSAGTPARRRPTPPTCAARCCASRPSRVTSPAGTTPGRRRDVRRSRRATCSRSAPRTRGRRSTTWASGSRSRVHTDPKNPGLIGVGEYCHDASADRPDRSPAGTCEWNLINKAGNFGWPFCVGDQSPANTMTRWNYAANVDARAEVRLHDGPDPVRHQLRARPARRRRRRRSRAWADPEADRRRRSGRSTRHRTAGLARASADFGNLTEGGMQPVSGPIYRYNRRRAGTRRASRPTTTARG